MTTNPEDNRREGLEGGSERRFSRLLAQHVLDRPNGDPDDDLAVLSRQLLRADEALTATRDSWGKAESRRDRLAALNAELLDALKALHAVVKEQPGMQGREFVSLGVQVTNAIAKASLFTASPIVPTPDQSPPQTPDGKGLG